MTPPRPPRLEPQIEAAINAAIRPMPDRLWDEGVREIVVLAKILPGNDEKKFISVTKVIKLR